MKAVGKLFEDPKRAEAIASAIGGLQRAKAAIDEAQRKALHAAGLVTRDDFKAAGKRLSHLKRRGKGEAGGAGARPRPPAAGRFCGGGAPPPGQHPVPPPGGGGGAGARPPSA